MDTSNESPEITRIGKYQVLEVLGRGGMGVVYRAVDRQLGREVAIKTLTQGVTGDKEMLARFYEEGRKTARLKHPNIIIIFDLGEENGVPYIVMERVEGQPLDAIIRRGKPLSIIEQVRIMEEVCSALGHAHANNLIHRDVKPANIFVQPDGKAKLLDFGIARLERRSQELSLTRAGTIIGTVPYMAPERFTDREIDGRSDIFSAGVVLYQLVSGQLPFNGDDYVLMQRIINEPHVPLSKLCSNYPPGLEAIVDRALAKAPDDRYQTAEEMAADLNSISDELSEQRAVELLPEARRLLEADDFTRARMVLQQVLKVNSRHTAAREMLSEVQRRMLQKQRDERRGQLVLQAEEALSRREFDQGLVYVKEALQLDSRNTELLSLQARVQQEKLRQEQIANLMGDAEAARRKGDFDAALASAEEALQADGTNSKIIALYNVLAQEAEHAQRKSQARILLDTARRQLEARQFESALERLRKVEELTPADPELHVLLEDATVGAEHSRRRRLVTELEEQAGLASTLEQLQTCAAAIHEALGDMPADSVLIRLSAQVNRKLVELGNRTMVEETFQKCRELRPREALELVRKTRQTIPSDERLLSLERLLTQRIQQQSLEERRAEHLARARTALKESRFHDAVVILEACQADDLATTEVLALLEMARSEALEQSRVQTQRGKVQRAQELVSAGVYEEAIEFLDKAIAECEDPVLGLIREQAASALGAVLEKADAALASAGKLARAGKPEAALQMLRSLPADVLRLARVQLALAALDDEKRASVFRMTGRAYAVVEDDVWTGHRIMQRVAAASSDASTTATLARAFQSREQASADRALADAVARANGLLKVQDKRGAEEVLARVSRLHQLASADARAEWNRQLTRMEKKRLAVPRSH